MLRLEDYRTIFVAAGLIGILICALPTLSLALHLPTGEKFSELYVLGPAHMAEGYPFNVTADMSYMVYVGVGNHMGSSAYYVVYVKFRNQTEPLPNATTGTPSPQPPLYEYRIVLQDGKSWEGPLAFSLSGNQTLVDSLVINGVAFSVNEHADWDSAREGYYYQLFFELWIYNAEVDSIQFHNRYVTLWFNMTAAI
jgi:hypothetical protein